MKKMRKITWMLLAVIISLMLGCASRPMLVQESYAPQVESGEREKTARTVVEREAAVAEDSAGLPSGSGQNTVSLDQAIERKIIYNVSLHLIVKDTDEAFSEVQRLAQEMGGFIAESNTWKDEAYRRATVTVRVPVGALDDALAKFRALALDVETENVDSDDVTADYVDLEGRLTNEQRTEVELRELLETRSEIGKTEDILEVHRELSRVRANIEQIQGQMRVLDNFSAMATVRIQLTPDELMQPIDVGGWKPQGTARDAIRMLLRTLQFFADVVIIFVLYILPTVVVIAIPITVLVLIVRALWRWFKRRKRAKAAE